MKIKIIANNCNWKSWDSKIDELYKWFLPAIKIDFSIEFTSFTDIPFVNYANADMAVATNNTHGIDPHWYDEYITSKNLGNDIILFVMNLDEWQGMNARGWRTDSDQGPIQLQVAANENEVAIWPNFPSMSAFFQIARHEILHALFMITGQKDTTHYWWNQGKLENARDSIKLQKNYFIPSIQKALAYIFSLLLNIKKEVDNLPKEDQLVSHQPIDPTQINPSKREKLYLVAKSCLGIDASPNDVAPDEFGCAETVNAIYKKCFGKEIGGTVSTYLMYMSLSENIKDFKIVTEALPGDIIISPTSLAKKGTPFAHGHVGIVGENGVIMSNESSSGKFVENYTMESWRERYEKIGMYPIFIFRLVE